MQLDDFMDEEPTLPHTRLDVVQQELDTAESVASSQFLAQAMTLGYSVNPPKYWNTLEVECDGETVMVEAMTFLEVV